VIAASDTSTVEIVGSLPTAVFIPRLQQLPPIFQYKPSDLIQLPGRKAVIAGKHNGFQPKLAEHVLALDVNVPWLKTVEAVKEKPIRSRNPFD
jgi:hypothetical protein